MKQTIDHQDDAATRRRLIEAYNRARTAPAIVIGGLCIAAYVIVTLTQGNMLSWAVSVPALKAGHYETLILHMFAHGGLIHLGFNTVALFSLTPLVMDRLGPPRTRAYVAYAILFLLCGLGGAFMWLALNADSSVPMLGASGALFGLLGFLLRQPDPRKPASPLFSMATVRAFWEIAKAHIVLVAIFILPMLLGAGFGLAWEAHLGGFIVGLLIFGPLTRWAKEQPR